ncbi:aminoimidazole riboside kinase, partial [Aeromonas media]
VTTLNSRVCSTSVMPPGGVISAVLASGGGLGGDGALATTAKGAMTALPTRTQLDEFLRSGASGR